jgi:protein-tyrosine phosphatase
MGRTEIHFHLLPGVDDGPATLEESLELARMALRDGTLTIVTTPHVCDVEVGELKERVRRLRLELAAARLPIELMCGGEVNPADVLQLSDEELAVVAQGPPGKRWVLLESLHDGAPESFAAAAEELRRRGFGIVIAHPERSAPLDHGRASVIRDEVAAGAWLQVNGMSITGGYGETVKRAALELLAGEWPVVISSDAHSQTRPPCLSDAAHVARQAGVDPCRIRQAADHGPRHLLDAGLPRTPTNVPQYAL